MSADNSLSNDTNTARMGFVELIDNVRLFAHLTWENRSLLIRAMGIGLAVGLFIALGGPNEYTATAQLLPYRGGPAGATSLSNLAGLAGVRLPAGVGDQTITVDLYPAIARSQEFRISVAETPLKFGDLEQRATAVQYFRELRKPSLLERLTGNSIGLPRKLITRLTTPRNRPLNQEHTSDTTDALLAYDPEYIRIITDLSKRMTVVTDKKTDVITITGRMPDPYAAADFVRVISARMMERIINYESRKAREQFHFVEKQLDSARTRYEAAQRSLAIFQDQNRILNGARAKVALERLQRDNDLAYEIFQQLSRELEQARLKMNQDTPVFTVIDRVTVPTNRSNPGRGTIVLACVIGGLMLGVGHLGVRNIRHEYHSRHTGAMSQLQ